MAVAKIIKKGEKRLFFEPFERTLFIERKKPPDGRLLGIANAMLIIAKRIALYRL
jgi:hypothetical protein